MGNGGHAGCLALRKLLEGAYLMGARFDPGCPGVL